VAHLHHWHVGFGEQGKRTLAVNLKPEVVVVVDPNVQARRLARRREERVAEAADPRLWWEGDIGAKREED